jgi:hypothetical protein
VGTWDQLAAGQGTAVVWASTSPTFAVLYSPHAAVPEFSGRFSRKKAKAREEEAMRQSAIAAAAANAAQAVCVQVSSKLNTTQHPDTDIVTLRPLT